MEKFVDAVHIGPAGGHLYYKVRGRIEIDDAGAARITVRRWSRPQPGFTIIFCKALYVVKTIEFPDDKPRQMVMVCDPLGPADSLMIRARETLRNP